MVEHWVGQQKAEVSHPTLLGVALLSHQGRLWCRSLARIKKKWEVCGMKSIRHKKTCQINLRNMFCCGNPKETSRETHQSDNKKLVMTKADCCFKKGRQLNSKNFNQQSATVAHTSRACVRGDKSLYQQVAVFYICQWSPSLICKL